MDQLFVRESGPPDAPVIVFLHGVGNTGQMWRGHMDALTAFRCLAPDLPGHGRSARVPWTSRSAAADRVIELIESRPARRAHVVGLSLGGSVALEILGRRPDVLEHVVIDGCAATPTRVAPVMKGLVGLVAPFIRSRPVGRAVAAAVGVRDPAAIADLLEQLAQVDPASFRRAFGDAQDVRPTDTLLGADCPTLFVAGEAELANVRASNRLLADLMPHATSMFMPGVGHGWLGPEPDVHIAMVAAHVEGRPLPAALRTETATPARLPGRPRPKPAGAGRP